MKCLPISCREELFGVVHDWVCGKTLTLPWQQTILQAVFAFFFHREPKISPFLGSFLDLEDELTALLKVILRATCLYIVVSGRRGAPGWAKPVEMIELKKGFCWQSHALARGVAIRKVTCFEWRTSQAEVVRG